MLVNGVAAAGIERTLIAAGLLVAVGNILALSTRSVRTLPRLCPIPGPIPGPDPGAPAG
jgi:hypothetical protein